MKNIFLSLISIFSLLSVPIAVSQSALALDSSAESGFEKGIKDTGGSSGQSVSSFIQSIINILLFIAGVIAVVMVVIGGLRFVLSNGDSGATSKARNTIIYALVGLVITIMSYAIVNFVLGNI